MDLRALADFLLVATHRGFAQAERMAGRPKATLSRRVRELEKDLGVRLFNRDTRTLRLTDEGHILLARTRGLLTDVAEAEIALRGTSGQPQGLLRISAPILFSEIGLGSIGASYLRRYPAVRLEIVSEDRMTSPIEDSFDVVIRLNPSTASELVGRCFLRDHRQVVASPSLAQRISVGEVWPSVVLTNAEGRVWRLRQGERVREIAHDPVMRVSAMLTVRDAVLSGTGAGILPGLMVADHLASGRLVKVGDVEGGEVAMWALHPSQRLASRKVTSFLEHLVGCFPGEVWPAGGFEPTSATSENDPRTD
ncbi:LysR family transcriptional regulator [Sphingomonas sp. CGMCC 1.13654]|uniref:LysR family transcriptional regulator n=1 Tax=Sphingomonas chungangi TaxID=2683589 RepID=A0A838L2T7_9SPHN|nr:LysR family transcriptional regulator [Sphingomonas chungangi]MBA2933504.1 LysR family transcriptional regulator [Sphingomonas chungangi]MVW54837.1 LysR family transcriptional regulator [Sphingomonas chungangi]